MRHESLDETDTASAIGPASNNALEIGGSETGAKIAALDGWRGLAILLVLVGHFVPGLDALAPYGVEFFFVLSGRLMAEILFSRRTDLKRFYFRRVFRIIPALYVYLFAVAALTFIQSTTHLIPRSPPIASWEGLIAAATMTFNYWYLLAGHSSAIDHIWSLCVEEHSYIFLGIIAATTYRTGHLRLMLGAAVALTLLNGVLLSLIAPDGVHVYWRSDVRSFGILISAWMLCSRVTITAGMAKFLLVSALAGSAMTVWFTNWEIEFTVGTALLAFVVVNLEKCPKALMFFFEAHLLRWLGKTSFSIYLWQELFYKASGHLPSAPKIIWVMLSIGIGAASVEFIENPCRLSANNWFESRRAGRTSGSRWLA